MGFTKQTQFWSFFNQEDETRGMWNQSGSSARGRWLDQQLAVAATKRPICKTGPNWPSPQTRIFILGMMCMRGRIGIGGDDARSLVELLPVVRLLSFPWRVVAAALAEPESAAPLSLKLCELSELSELPPALWLEAAAFTANAAATSAVELCGAAAWLEAFVMKTPSRAFGT